MASRSKDDASKDGPLELAGLLIIVVAVMIFLVWMAGSNRIVALFTPMLRAVGSTWAWLPSEAGASSALEVYRTARVFLERPERVDFFAFAAYVNLAIAPLTTAIAAVIFLWFCATIVRRRQEVFRRFRDADDLLRGISRVFTGTAPILHIRRDIAAHKDPKWARQRFPEEVLFEDRVAGDPLVGREPKDPSKLVVKPDVIERWLRGIEPSSGCPAAQTSKDGKRRRSRTLGWQLVDLADPADRLLFKPDRPVASESFVDRFSDVGKVMFGLLCAHAFGGKEGIDDWRKARDQLNNSCRGAKHGLPNLTVAQWLVDKYRHNDLARKLFAVHHWEYTYLFELFVQAKRRGKIPDSEFRWLKPADRSLWYVLNTVGRFTPHTESAAAFNMHAFERKCARRKRWPLRINGATERIEPSIYVKGAVQGLVLEFERWVAGTDENDDEWWKDRHEWVVSSRMVAQAGAAPAAPGNTEAARQLSATTFDQTQSAARARAEEAQRAAEIGELMGTSAGAGAGTGSGVRS